MKPKNCDRRSSKSIEKIYLQLYDGVLIRVLAVGEVVTPEISGGCFIGKVPAMTSAGGQRQLRVQGGT